MMIDAAILVVCSPASWCKSSASLAWVVVPASASRAEPCRTPSSIRSAAVSMRRGDTATTSIALAKWGKLLRTQPSDGNLTLLGPSVHTHHSKSSHFANSSARPVSGTSRSRRG